MAWELEGLIARLLVRIACAGEQGCLVTDFHNVTKSISDAGDGAASHRQASRDDFPHQGIAAIWTWIVQRDDISVGPENKYNHLPFDQVLSLAESGTSGPNRRGGKPTPHRPSGRSGDIRIHVSEQTMWEAITGHSVDYKRVPRSEWLLLLGIASAKDEGILQGDLGRLVEQDKRSVPKRTDALVKKGYITKRTTLVRGTKTSKLWLKSCAPSQPREGSFPIKLPEVEMNLSHQVLAVNLDPVPWHERWTGESVDYTALATTIMAICKEWDVMRMQDLKAKLGVLGMRWQMKVVSKVCRFLNARDAIRYVAARLNSKVFKDCIRYNRDLNVKDWSIFLATGKRPGRPSRFPEAYVDGSERTSDVVASATYQAWGSSRLDFAPPWSMDLPLPVAVVKAIIASGEAGLTNPDIYGITLGATFTRFLSSMTTTMSTPGLQPPHLKHLQVKSEHFRLGKVASYRFSVQQKTTFPSTSSPHTYGFSSCPYALRAALLADLCAFGPSRAKHRGRPKKIKKEKEEPVDAPERGDEQEAQGIVDSALSGDQGAKDRKDSLIVTMKLSPDIVRVLFFGEDRAQLASAEGSQLGGDASDEDGDEEGDEDRGSGDAENDGIELARPDNKDHTGADGEELLPSEGRGSGRSRGRGRGRGRGRSRKGQSRGTGVTGPGSAVWKCDKCGGAWRNDNGLKYHLEKSRSSCNPSWNPPPIEAKHQRRHDLASSPGRTSIDSLYQDHRSKRRKIRGSLPGIHFSDDGPSSGELDGNRGTVTKAVVKRELKLPKSEPEIPAQLSQFGLSKTPLLKNMRPLRQIDPLEVRLRRLHERRRPDGSHMDIGNGRLTTGLATSGAPVVEVSLPARLAPSQSPWLEDGKDQDDMAIVVKTEETPERRRSNQRPDKAPPKKKSQRQEAADRISALVNRMLLRHSGVLPGGESLWRALTAVWVATFPTEPVPKPKDCQWALSRMLKEKSVLEHWHGFQGQNCTFFKCQIITLPHVDTFSPESLFVLDRIKQAHPQLYIPEAYLTLDTGVETDGLRDVRRGRRLLSGEVVNLDAPVYAAQMATKRGPDPAGEVADDAKRPKYASNARHQHRANEHDSGRHKEPDLDWDPPPSLLVQDRRFCFLAPNTFLQDDPSDQSIAQLRQRGESRESPPTSGGDDLNTNLDPQLFDKGDGKNSLANSTNTIMGRDGTWPALESSFFMSEYSANFTACGWMPDGDWHSWAAFNQHIDRYAGSRRQRGRSSQPFTAGDEATQHCDVGDRLKACLDLELMWAASVANAKHMAAGPHNIFIDFAAGPSITTAYPNVVWPPEGQMTLQSASSLLQREVETLSIPILSDEEEGEEEEEEEDGDERQPRAVTKGQRPSPIPEPSESLVKAKTKKVALVTRALTAIPEQPVDDNSSQSQSFPLGIGAQGVEKRSELLAAFVAVRVLLGGADKAIDWGLLVNIFPDVGLEGLRRFWLTACKEQGAFLRKFTRAFQARLIEAFENDELPMLDFDNLLDYDWLRLIRWATQIPHQEGFQIPPDRHLLDSRYTLESVKAPEEDWREKFFHAQSSIFSRFEAITADPGAVSSRYIGVSREDVALLGHDDDAKDMEVAKSWIKSLCYTGNAKYSAEQIKNKLLTLSANTERNNTVLKAAVDHLTKQRVICRSKRPPLGGRPYKLSEWYTTTLNKLCQRPKFVEAAAFKALMDRSFRRREEMEISYTLNDGTMMALMNLSATGRINIVLVDVPNIPFGFEPGNYESRKFPKSYYHFRLKAVPTDSYLFNQDIDVLEAALNSDLPCIGPRGEIPQWVDFFGDCDVKRWSEVLGAFCFAYATRGSMTIKSVCSALRPVLEEFEAELIVEWGRKTGIIETAIGGSGISVGEWWWLAVPSYLASGAE